MKTAVTIKENQLQTAVEIANKIVEFDEIFGQDYMASRYADKDHLILTAHIDLQPVGFLIGYDKYGDGSFYCWLAGVDPTFRRRGVLRAMMIYLKSWSQKHGYDRLLIKTRNTRRGMLAFLVENDFNFIGLETRKEARENRILFEIVLK